MTKESLSGALCDHTLDRLVGSLGLEEWHGEDGGPLRRLVSIAPIADGEIGSIRYFSGGPVERLVKITLVVPQIMLDSHMIFAFTAADSALPHFTLDSVEAGEHFAFHLDLIPRADLGAHRDYMNEIFHPLSPLREQALAIEGLSRAHLSPRQLAIMSPWMLANRATESAFVQIREAVDGYLDHWFKLVDSGVSDAAMSGLDAQQLADRDRANRGMIFSSDIDPVWNRITGLLGEDVVAYQQQLLRGEVTPERNA